MQRIQTGSNASTVRFDAARRGDQLDYELDVRRLELRHQGQPVHLRRQAIRVLALLVQQEGRLVTTDQLRRELWGDQKLGWRSSLHQCVRDLRRALSDDARRPRFVSTVARSGYRFVGTSSATAAPGATHRAFRAWPWGASAPQRPSVAFIAGFGAALLLPASFLIVCAVLAG